MKKLWCIIIAVLACNIISLLALANNEHISTSHPVECCISQQHSSTLLNNDSNTTLQQPESVAIVSLRTNISESNTSTKDGHSNNNKLNNYSHRKYTKYDNVGFVVFYDIAIAFSRAIDHYIYAFRHIII